MSCCFTHCDSTTWPFSFVVLGVGLCYLFGVIASSMEVLTSNTQLMLRIFLKFVLRRLSGRVLSEVSSDVELVMFAGALLHKIAIVMLLMQKKITT